MVHQHVAKIIMSHRFAHVTIMLHSISSEAYLMGMIATGLPIILCPLALSVQQAISIRYTVGAVGFLKQ